MRSFCLLLKLGPFIYRIRSNLPSVYQGIQTLYPDKIVEDTDELFVDFDLQIVPPIGVRRWVFPQVVFKIDQHSPFQPLGRSEGLALLEWGMNWCIGAYLNRYVVIHAAVLERNGRYLVAPASSGSGKSTLAAGLMFSGWNLISDELCIIDPETLQVIPTERAVSLKNASINLIPMHFGEAVLSETILDTKKGDIAFVRPKSAVISLGEPAPGLIVMPHYQPQGSPSVEPVSSGNAMMAIIDNAFNYSITGETGFRTVSRLVRGCEAYNIQYQNLDQAVSYCDQLAQKAGF